MNNQYRKYKVYNAYGKESYTVIAHGLNIKGDGTLEFISSGSGSYLLEAAVLASMFQPQLPPVTGQGLS